MQKSPVFILKNSLNYKKGSIITEYKEVKDGILIENDFLSNSQIIKLNENLSTADEEKVKEMIKAQIKFLFWNLYTKSNMFLAR